MSEPVPDHEIDGLIRAYLDQQASRFDPDARISRIHLSLEIDRAAEFEPILARSPTRSFRGRRWVMGLVAAASILLAVVGVLQVRTTQLSAEEIVHQVKEVHSLPMDRCYLIESRSASALPEESLPLLSRLGDCQLWTRGDRFWIESVKGSNRWSLGRDEQGSLWIAIARQQGLQFDSGEIPERVALRCDVLSVRLETLLNDVLRDFELHREPASEGKPRVTMLIRATPKSGRLHPILREARFEVDVETKVLRKLVLNRTLQGRSITTTFTLVDAQRLDDSSYQIEGHLDPDSPIYRHDHEPLKRRQLLMRFLGRRQSGWESEDKTRENVPPTQPSSP